MSIGDFLRLPPAVQIAFVVMLWPAIWAGAALLVAFVTDILRQVRKRDGFRSETTPAFRG